MNNYKLCHLLIKILEQLFIMIRFKLLHACHATNTINFKYNQNKANDTKSY